MLEPRRVVLVGAASAIAEQVGRSLANRGDTLALVGRSPERLQSLAADFTARGSPNVIVRQLDLAGSPPPELWLAEIAKTLGGVDAVLLFHGVLGEQSRAENDLAHAREILGLNFNSAAEIALAAANLLEQSAHPRPVLLAMGSVAGDRGRASNYVYGAAKAGLAVLFQGLAHRYAKGRVRVILIKAGFVDTPMTAQFDKGGPLWASARQVADRVVAALDRGGGFVYAPGFWRYIMLVIRLLPSSIMHRLKI